MNFEVTRDSQLFHFLMLAMYSGQIGLFSSRDLLLFFIMWELELIPVYLLISMWGGRNACIQLQSLFCTLREAPFFYYWEFWAYFCTCHVYDSCGVKEFQIACILIPFTAFSFDCILL